MADVFSKQKRSEVMSQIRSHGNKGTELRLIRIFKAFSITGWRRRQLIFGRPDFVFRKERVAVFVDGCFWHACPKCYSRPTSNTEFWDNKALKNTQRDRAVTAQLKREGWKVVRIWEHQLKHPRRVAWRIQTAITGRATGTQFHLYGESLRESHIIIKNEP